MPPGCCGRACVLKLYALSGTESALQRRRSLHLVPEDFEVPFGKARIRRPGKDLTIITYGNTAHLCLNVAELLYKEKGWELEVIDLRTLIPLDKEAIFNSVKKTSKVLIVHETRSSLASERKLPASSARNYSSTWMLRSNGRFPIHSGWFPSGLGTGHLPNEETIYHAAKNCCFIRSTFVKSKAS